VRALVQRVSSASVSVDGELVGSIGPGLCVFAGVTHDDDDSTAERMADKLWHLRVFADEAGLTNRCASELDAELMVISQFTLYADTARGRRPSFVAAADPQHAEPLVDRLVGALVELGASVVTGRFRAQMAVTLTNDGPLTIMLEV
jgi:D-aminoacyl-tRNA deacylase